jgi:hypothetical protein
MKTKGPTKAKIRKKGLTKTKNGRKRGYKGQMKALDLKNLYAPPKSKDA